ncbi:MAG TPA: porin [Deltaproteobacteria bacterium]|nr:porin [Deltaproteobacteria bacterium]HRW80506.1 porin [Desulfomonilia bacterium]HNS90648.1 porin [Deltaproteobacteria bacterium]HOA44993.1 porin [Deltaproteobacteria bacterium]HOC76849.1 porin [Deltaproteobacteria bacterium]
MASHTTSERGPWPSILLGALVIVMLVPVQAAAERIYFAGYKGGFYIRSEEEGGMELRLGGSFQTDYRAYAEHERADNRFDIRKARLIFGGQVTEWFRFGLEYEFQGNETSNLVDAWGEWAISGLEAVRFGQFKEPFSLEWQGADKAQWFAERSMGYYLTPMRDIGIMFTGSAFHDSLNYGVGLFNGDGDDGSTRGSDHDSPEITGRIALKPLSSSGTAALRNFQIGVSGSWAAIDTANIDLKVKSTGMAGLTGRNLYVLGHNTKFGVLQDVGNRYRAGAEAAWSMGPLAFAGEYLVLKYTELETVSQRHDAEFSSWYLSGAYCLTGEHFSLAGGTVNPIHPNRFFDPKENTWGAFILAARVEHFTGDEDWITEGANISVEKADAASAGITWILFPMLRLSCDFTCTDLSDSIRVRVNPDGSVDYVKRENVLTLRLSMDL